MTEPTRRDWLRALGAASTAGAAGLAGCSAFDAGGPTGDDTPGNGGPGNGPMTEAQTEAIARPKHPTTG